MSFTEISPFVTKDEKQRYLLKINESDWIQHKSTVSGRVSPLQFKPVKFRGIDCYLMKMDSNAIQDFHTDGVKLKRNTLIIHPLTDNYSPFVTQNGSSDKPIIADTQSKHAVYNNNYTRLNLQIPFGESYNDVHVDKNSVVWKLLNKFYKENDEQR